MPGIIAIVDPSNRDEETRALAPRMCEALKCSDREGSVEWYSHSGFAIGRCRPSLINQASQPAWNEERTICAFFHGEIFGYSDLKRSLERKGHRFSHDGCAEFVVHLYEDRGDAFIHELNGSFALALWDSRQRRLIIANDRYALGPIYAAQAGSKYLWASAPKAILADTTFRRHINLAAMADFLCLGMPQDNDTIFEGIDELPPASLVTCQEGQVRRQQYWDYSLQEEETGISAHDYLDEVIPLLEQAAERRQTGKLSAGLLLSGGFDSRVVLSALNKSDLKSFTYGTPFSDDVRLAQEVARSANVSHVSLEIRPDYLKAFAGIGIGRTEDLINCDYFHGISVYDQIAMQVNAVITGSVGEDIFGHFSRDPQDEFWGDGFSIDRYYDSKSKITDEELKQLVKPDCFQEMKGLARSRFHADMARCASRRTTHMLDYWSVRQQQRRLYNRLASLLPDNLVYRPLFFDNDLIDFVQTVPPSLRWGENSLYRQILLRMAPALAEIPATTTHGLPVTATHQQIARHTRRLQRLRDWRRRMTKVSLGLIPPMKAGSYTDYRKWLREELRGWAESILLDPQTLNRDYWRPSAIARLMEDHLRGQAGRRLATRITAVISLELWHRMYLDTE
jgi:asparagine synthase (glutamine-hydrolysing)